MTRIDWMNPGDEVAVRSLYSICHKGWPQKPISWYHVYPTLVARIAGKVVGFTTFAVQTEPDGRIVLYGQDVCVNPTYRGQRIARLLCDARLDVGKDVGAVQYVGVTRADNTAMVAILEAQGMTRSAVVPGHFTYDNPPADGVVYIRQLGGK